MRRFEQFEVAELAILGVSMAWASREDEEFAPIAQKLLQEVNEELAIRQVSHDQNKSPEETN